jgi:23S rRNA pseudouridine1911/1915/1917 synthase
VTSLRRLTVERGESLLTFLLGSLGLKRRAAKNLLKFGAVSVNGVQVRQFDHALAVGDDVVVDSVQSSAAAVRLKSARIQVVYEDDDLIVLDKPTHLLTVATPGDKTDTLFYRLTDYLRSRDPANPGRAWVVHRIDRETSGLVLFAKSEQAQLALQAAWPTVEKVYMAIVEGAPEASQGTITGYLTEASSLQVFHNDHQTPGARLAITHYRLLQTRGEYSLLEVRLQTGRKHQIRVHLAGMGCLVAGDLRYGSKHDPCKRLALHACELSLAHPGTGAPLRFSSPMPEAMRRLFPIRRAGPTP